MADSLVCAIDGENVSFALAPGGADLRLESVRQYRTADFPTFTDALQAYAGSAALTLEGLPLALAVAGISKNDVISFANCRWYVSVSGLRAFLRSDPLIVNDFAATAWSLAWADQSRIKPMGPLSPRRIAGGGTFLVVGTGSGLGMATLVVDPERGMVVLESEGGHMSFAPQSEAEEALLAELRRRFGHVSYERLLCHQGLQFLHGQASGDGAAQAPAAIVSAAVRGDRVACQAVDSFVRILGSFVGDGILASGAWDGVFLVGDFLGEMVPMLSRGAFRTQMTAKGRMARALERVPISYAGAEHACLTGAAAALRARSQG